MLNTQIYVFAQPTSHSNNIYRMPLTGSLRRYESEAAQCCLYELQMLAAIAANVLTERLVSDAQASRDPSFVISLFRAFHLGEKTTTNTAQLNDIYSDAFRPLCKVCRNTWEITLGLSMARQAVQEDERTQSPQQQADLSENQRFQAATESDQAHLLPRACEFQLNRPVSFIFYFESLSRRICKIRSQ